MAMTSRSRGMVRDAIAIAAIAVLTVQALRRWVGDRYLVPSGSMEPLLHGDPERGDVVFVDKLADRRAMRRHDLVVVQHPHDPSQQLVKRIAAIGDELTACWIDLIDGDILLGDGPQRSRLRREMKDPLAARGQRVPWAAAPGSRDAMAMIDLTAATGSGPWEVRAADTTSQAARRNFAADVRAARGTALPPGHVGTKRPVDAGFVQATGNRGNVGNDVLVTDVGIDAEITGITGDVLASIETSREALTFHWQPTSGEVVLWRDGVDVATAPFRVPAPPVDGSLRLEFGVLDDRVFCCFDGDPARLFVMARPDEWNGVGQQRVVAPRTVAHLGGVGPDGSRFVIRSLHVFHDVFVHQQGLTGPWPRHVPAGHWFLLGDSSFDSRDSRNFDSVPSRLFLGVPRWVVGPWSRVRRVIP